ncbi:MAG: phosphomannomutase/phosphoglucomutase, partial [Propionibacterium sp.]
MLKSDIFKANDIRGIVVGPDLQWDLAGAWDLGNAYVRLLELAGKEFVLGRDMRQLGVELAKAFIDGARAAGASVVDIGLASTDQLWFASGKLAMPGVQFTASHNPAEYNGIKFCLPNAGPVPAEFTTELAKLANQTKPVQSSSVGNYRSIDLLADYVSYLNSLVQV